MRVNGGEENMNYIFNSILMGLKMQRVSIPLVKELVMVVESNGREDGL